MMRTKPPFRADHVGSFLRSAAIKDARAKHESGDIDADQLREIEDREITAVIRKQEEIGLMAVTDGEYRRSWWHFDFLGGLDGVDVVQSDQGIQFQGRETKAQGIEVTGKLGFSDHPMIGHFRYLKDHAQALAKMTIPSPSVLHFRQDDAARRGIYPDIDAFFDDLGTAYATASTRAAVTFSSTTRCGPICARRSSSKKRASAATTPTGSTNAMPARSTPRSRPSPTT